MPAPDPGQRPERRTKAHQRPPTDHDHGSAQPDPHDRSAASVRDVDAPDVDAALDAIVDAAPPLPYEVRARLAWLLRGHHHARRDRAA